MTHRLSGQKANYLHDLSSRVADGSLDLSSIGRKSDEDVIDELIVVKGIGVWTAQMFLMFSLGRMNVFPADDLGIRVAIQNLYGFDEMPTRAECREVAEPWTPYATVASWYCWRSLDS